MKFSFPPLCFFRIFVACFLFLSSPSLLLANTASTYGLGSRMTSMGGAATGTDSGVFGSFYNPASLIQSERLGVSLGLLSADTDFAEISSVLVETEQTGNMKVVSDVSTDYALTRGTFFGLAIPLRKKYRRVALGLSGFVPFERLMRMSTAEPYVPSYPLYENRTQRFSLYGGGGVELLPHFSLGVGGAFFTNAAGQAFVRVNHAGNPVLMMSMDVVPALAPIAGLFYELRPFSAGLTWRGAADYKLDFVNESQTPAIAGGSTSLILGFDSSSTFFYDPQQVSLGASYKLFDDRLTLASDLSWEQWSRYETPLARFNSRGDVNFGSYIPAANFHDIWIPRFGAEYLFSSVLALRGGYFFQPTPISEVGAENLLDADKHVVSGGLGLKFANFLGFVDTPLGIDLHCQYHRLASRHITKSDQEAIGSPGFDVGGSIWNYGVTLSSAF